MLDICDGRFVRDEASPCPDRLEQNVIFGNSVRRASAYSRGFERMNDKSAKKTVYRAASKMISGEPNEIRLKNESDRVCVCTRGNDAETRTDTPPPAKKSIKQ